MKLHFIIFLLALILLCSCANSNETASNTTTVSAQFTTSENITSSIKATETTSTTTVPTSPETEITSLTENFSSETTTSAETVLYETDEDNANPGHFGSKDIRFNNENYYFFLDYIEFCRNEQGECYLILADPYQYSEEGFEFSEDMFLYDEIINDIIQNHKPVGKAKYVGDDNLKNDFDTEAEWFDNGDVYYFPDMYAGYYIYTVSDVPTYVVNDIEIYTYGYANKVIY